MKMKKNKASKKRSLISGNHIVLAALAGACTGLAVTYLLETEKGRNLLSQAGSSVKNLIGILKFPASGRA